MQVHDKTLLGNERTGLIPHAAKTDTFRMNTVYRESLNLDREKDNLDPLVIDIGTAYSLRGMT